MENTATQVPEKVTGPTAVVGVGEWLVTLIVAAIPLVNIVMFFVWAFGSNTKASKANWAKATLIFLAIAVVFYVVVIVAILGGIGILSSRF